MKMRTLKPYRVLIAGDHSTEEAVSCALGRLWGRHGNRLVVIEGDRTAADKAAALWANAWSKKGVYPQQLKAGRSEHHVEGIRRHNQRLLEEGSPDLIVAFPGGWEAADLIKRAQDAGIEVAAPLPDRRGTEEDPQEIILGLREAIGRVHERLTATEDDLVHAQNALATIHRFVRDATELGADDCATIRAIIDREMRD